MSQAIIQEIITLYQTFGNHDYIGEEITQIEHAMQCLQLAEKETEDLEVILAAFFHDIGHLIEISNQDKQMGTWGVVDHEEIGRKYLLSKGFSGKIAQLVANHVKAKRYLVTVYPDYYQKLSKASQETLKYQNGFMTPEEVEHFRKDQLFDLSLAIRGFDDQAKEVNAKIKPLTYLEELLKKYFTC